MSYVRVEVTHESEAFPSRRTILHVGNKAFTTPRRTLCLTEDPASEARAISNGMVTGLNEVPKELTKSFIDRVHEDSNFQDEFNAKLRRRLAMVNRSDDVNMFVFTYENRIGDGANVKPDPIETEYLANLLSHHENDLILPPIVPNLPTSEYCQFLTSFLEALPQFRSEARIAGLIPKVSRLEMHQVANLYLNKGVRIFAMDLRGKHPYDSYSYINTALSLISNIEKETGESCALNAINMPNVRGIASVDVVPAKDIVAFEMGFDCFGSSHVRPKFYIESGEYDPENNLRFFSRRDYGYYLVRARGLDSLLSEQGETSVALKDAMNARGRAKRKIVKLFNIERQGLEANEIQKHLIEHDLEPYFESKRYVSDKLPKMKKLKRR